MGMQGIRTSDGFWLNEANEVDKNDFDQLEMRCSGFFILDYNPKPMDRTTININLTIHANKEILDILANFVKIPQAERKDPHIKYLQKRYCRTNPDHIFIPGSNRKVDCPECSRNRQRENKKIYQSRYKEKQKTLEQNERDVVIDNLETTIKDRKEESLKKIIYLKPNERICANKKCHKVFKIEKFDQKYCTIKCEAEALTNKK